MKIEILFRHIVYKYNQYWGLKTARHWSDKGTEGLFFYLEVWQELKQSSFFLNKLRNKSDLICRLEISALNIQFPTILEFHIIIISALCGSK